MKKNIVLTDFICKDDDFSFIQSLNKYDMNQWHTMGCQTTGGGNKEITLLKWLLLVLKVFLKRNQFHNILAWQQFLGLFLSALCRLLHVRKKLQYLYHDFHIQSQDWTQRQIVP